MERVNPEVKEAPVLGDGNCLYYSLFILLSTLTYDACQFLKTFIKEENNTFNVREFRQWCAEMCIMPLCGKFGGGKGVCFPQKQWDDLLEKRDLLPVLVSDSDNIAEAQSENTGERPKDLFTLKEVGLITNRIKTNGAETTQLFEIVLLYVLSRRFGCRFVVNGGTNGEYCAPINTEGSHKYIGEIPTLHLKYSASCGGGHYTPLIRTKWISPEFIQTLARPFDKNGQLTKEYLGADNTMYCANIGQAHSCLYTKTTQLVITSPTIVITVNKVE